MSRYTVNEGIKLQVDGESFTAGDPIDGDYEAWERKGWVTKAPEFPISDYESLRAKDIVEQLNDLSPDEIKIVVAHEATQSRPRKTILRAAQELLTSQGG